MLTISMGACSSNDFLLEEESLSNNENKITNIIAVIGSFDTEDFGSRTTITMGESTIDQPVWAENDSIGIYPIDNEKQQTNGDQLSFRITNGIGTSTCAFDGGGWGLKNSQFYCAYTPFNRAYYYKEVNELPVSMLGQKQKGNGSTAHMGKYDLQIAIGRTPENGKVNFQFQHQVCFLRMDLTAPIAATWKSITLESDASFTTEAVMNLASSTPTVTPTSTSNQITLELENVITTSEDLSIVAYMMLLPVNLTNKTLNIILTDNEGNTYATEASITSANHNFGAAKARWIKAKDFQVNIHVEEAGTLSSYITEENKYLITSLKISGELNGKDIDYIRDLAYLDYNINYTINRNLISLDLGNAKIITSDDTYYAVQRWYTIIENVIGEYMFSQVRLSSITLPTTTIGIENYAFSNCDNLISLTIPDNVNHIGKRAFEHCSSLTSLIIPQNITKIEEGTFADCSSLESVILPENLLEIESYAFDWCSGLKELKIPDKVTEIKSYTFAGSIPNLILYLGKNISIIRSYGIRHTGTYIYAETPPTLEKNAIYIESLLDENGDYCMNLKYTLLVPANIYGLLEKYQNSDWAEFYNIEYFYNCI